MGNLPYTAAPRYKRKLALFRFGNCCSDIATFLKWEKRTIVERKNFPKLNFATV